MKYKEIDGKESTELLNMLGENRTTLHRLRMQRGINQLKDVRAIRETRKSIARILTKLSVITNAKAKA